MSTTHAKRKRRRTIGPVDDVTAKPNSPDTQTKALLHFDGVDGENVFLDVCEHGWNPNGSAQIDTAQSKFGGASGLFSGADYIWSDYSPDWQLDDASNANNWTVDFWVRFAGDPSGTQLGFVSYFQAPGYGWDIWYVNTVLRFQLLNNGGNVFLIDNAWDPAAATWYHIAVVKQGTTGYKMFINGTQIGTTQTNTTTLPDFNGLLRIGIKTNAGGDNHFLNGWIDEMRISKGIARWTANFTPPTAPY